MVVWACLFVAAAPAGPLGAASASPTPKASPSASPAAPEAAPSPAVEVASIDPEDLNGFASYPPSTQALVRTALALTERKLGYRFGSSDPATGGMDCSGTIFHVLRAVGIEDVPRTASDQYVWARKAGTFEPVVSRDIESFELDALAPGDLLFWTGTYATDRDPPVTHTMIYLGTLKADGRPVMFGASEGRSFGGRRLAGVSVFDFRIPPLSRERNAPGSVFIGYARVPEATKMTAPSSGEQAPAGSDDGDSS